MPYKRRKATPAPPGEAILPEPVASPVPTPAEKPKRTRQPRTKKFRYNPNDPFALLEQAASEPQPDILDESDYDYRRHYPVREQDVTATCDYCGKITRSPIGPMDQPSEELKTHIARQFRPFTIHFVETPTYFYPERRRLDFTLEPSEHIPGPPPISNSSCDDCNERIYEAQRRLRGDDVG